MPTIVDVPQQQSSRSTHGSDGRDVVRDRRVTDRDVRYPATPRPDIDQHHIRLGSADARAFREAVIATHFRPFPMPISRVEPVSVTPGDPQRAADPAGAGAPGDRFRSMGWSWWPRRPTSSRRIRSIKRSPSWG